MSGWFKIRRIPRLPHPPPTPLEIILKMSLIPPFANELVLYIVSFADLDSLIKLTQVKSDHHGCETACLLTLGIGLKRRTNPGILDIDNIPPMAAWVPGRARNHKKRFKPRPLSLPAWKEGNGATNKSYHHAGVPARERVPSVPGRVPSPIHGTS